MSLALGGVYRRRLQLHPPEPPGITLIARHTMDQKLIDARANPGQANIEAETEIRELSLNELDHVAGGSLYHACCAGAHYPSVIL